MRSSAPRHPKRCIVRAMRVRLLAFASAADALGASELSWEIEPGATVGALRFDLATRVPRLEPLLPRLAIAIRGTLAREVTELREGDEVALLPPVSGG